jgi:hypothetical protein
LPPALGRDLWLTAASLMWALASGCVVVPWPHKVDFHCDIRGRVIDDDTGAPVAGVEVFLATRPGESVVTGRDGRFALGAQRDWRLFRIALLAPWDSATSWEMDELVFEDTWSSWRMCVNQRTLEPVRVGRYRRQTISVYGTDADQADEFFDSLPPPRGEYHESLGTVRLTRSPFCDGDPPGSAAASGTLAVDD